jgi:hypothetical protein
MFDRAATIAAPSSAPSNLAPLSLSASSTRADGSCASSKSSAHPKMIGDGGVAATARRDAALTHGVLPTARTPTEEMEVSPPGLR